MVDGFLLNPAYAGYQPVFSATLFDRHQWLNLEGAPNTQTLSVHSAFPKTNVGSGFLVSRDAIGIHQDLSVFYAAAYRVKFPIGMLSMGLSIGFNYLSSDFNKLNLDPTAPDPTLNRGLVRNFEFNAGTGLYFNSDNFYVGFSVPALLENNLDDFNISDVNQFEQRNLQSRYYYLTGGIVLPLGPYLDVVPSTLIRAQENQALQFDINANFVFDEVFTAGASYRSGESIFFLAMVNLSENWRFGYGYDYVLSGLGQVTSGTHEFMMSYRKALTPKWCHSYF